MSAQVIMAYGLFRPQQSGNYLKFVAREFFVVRFLYVFQRNNSEFTGYPLLSFIKCKIAPAQGKIHYIYMCVNMVP